MKRLNIFIVSYLLWLLLTWPYNSAKGWDRQVLILGLGASFLGAILLKELPAQRMCKVCSPRRWFWFLVYIPVFIYECIKANLDVLYRVSHPEMPIKAGIVKIKTNLRSPSALTALANSITLAPGTMSVDITEDGYIYIHWIYVRTTDIDEATKIIAQRFEKFIRRIFE